MPIKDLEKYSKFTADNKELNPEYKPLNFEALRDSGALRVTHQGMDGGKFNPDPKAGFSLVSAYNDAVGKDSGTSQWKDNPSAYGVVKNMFEKSPEDIGAHKYMQIVESAKDLGLKEQDIFLEDRSNYNKGGTVKSQTKRLLAKGGLKHEGNTKDPVSGNNVPVGAMQEEVRDDIPAQLSEGEFVFPADVVRFIGLERLMVMRQMAKKGLMKMEDMGQMSNGDEADEEDDIANFESEIDDIMGDMDSEDDDEPREMAEGGAVMPAQAPMAPTPAAPMQSPAAAQTPAALGQAPEASAGGMSTRDIISESMKVDNFTPQERTAVSTFLTSPVAKDMVTLRNNNTLFMVMGAEPGVVTAQTFSTDPPEVLQDSVSKFIASLKEAKIKELRGETKNPMLLQSYEENGLAPESTEENGIISYRLSIPQDTTAPAPETAPPPEMPPAAAPAQSPTPMV